MHDVVSALEDLDHPLFVTHRHADRDSLGAALGLQALLGRGTVCTPDGIAKSAQSLLSAVGTDPVEDPKDVSFDRMVILDAPSTERIAPVTPSNPILIDHHEPDELRSKATAALVDTEADATAALVAQLAVEANWELTADAALPLLVGIFGDTENLTDASSETIRLTGTLISSLGGRTAEFPGLIRQTPDSSRQIARTMGTLRARGYRAGDIVVAFTQVSGHETAAANALRDQGVDCVSVLSEQSEGYRVVVRASDSFSKRLNLGTALLPAIAAKFGGDGGGHAGAGVATVESDDRDAIEAFILEYIGQHLGTSFGAVGE